MTLLWNDFIKAEEAKWTDEEREEHRREAAQIDASLDVAEVIYKARMDAGLSQSELGDLIGRSQSFISTLESGEANPTVKTLALIGYAVGRRFNFEFA